ncbi:MAG TPA: flagellar export chaperone FliS [Bacillus sp. (in: firmicutes)]|uniref:flagellar export chaperone FliS n=1 Tax=Bacillus litorisediminis TaxID=2922713 RepID=UPI001FAF539F|nr:flagellar export chaperone FliS [Bacillus litorisediminis]HWO77285.1 flagellar export chaperone FliS [Bacillus sp. (in: firmicutes)]
MAMKNPYKAYQDNSVNTATPGELTLMLYNGCIKFIRLAKLGLDEKNIEQKNTNIQKAQRIIQELMVTLNPDFEISQQMLPLYDYMNRRLIEANVKNDRAILDEVEGFVTEFRDTWKQVIQLNRKQPVNGAETSVSR